MRTVIALALLLTAGAAPAQPPAPPPHDVIVVGGEAVVRRAPDVASVTVAVETRAKSPRDAQRQNADAMAAVLKRIGDAGIAREALRTVGVRLEQEFDNANGKRVPREYVARNAVEVRVDEIARVGELLDVAVQGGATAISAVRFDVRDREIVEREALRLAVVDARTRAEAAAAGAGRAVDRIIRVEDIRDGGGGMPRPMMAMARAADDATASQTRPRRNPGASRSRRRCDKPSAHRSQPAALSLSAPAVVAETPTGQPGPSRRPGRQPDTGGMNRRVAF
jgi:uncharacterized protein YggE